MSDFNKLKSYLNESRGGNSAFTKVGDFFSNLNRSSTSASTEALASSSDPTTDTWFSQADNDPYCPKLVINKLAKFKIVLITDYVLLHSQSGKEFSALWYSSFWESSACFWRLCTFQ